MLKLLSKDGSKNVWLVGPTMRIGSARDNEIPLTGPEIGALHGYLHIDVENVVYEPVAGQPSYINENAVTKKTAFSLSDTLRLGSHEFSLSDPQEAKKKAAESGLLAKKTAPSDEDTQSTVFRQVAVPEASGWMIQGLHPSLKNKRFPIDGTMTLGRANDCELSFANERLSRKHAQFRLLDGVLFVKDLDSSNGVFHNGEKVTQAKLTNGDSIAFDKLEFTVIAPKAEEASLAQQADNENATVVRAAITPEQIKQAQQAQAKAKAEPTQAPPSIETEASGTNTAVIIGVAVVVVLIAAAAFIL